MNEQNAKTHIHAAMVSLGLVTLATVGPFLVPSMYCLVVSFVDTFLSELINLVLALEVNHG